MQTKDIRDKCFVWHCNWKWIFLAWRIVYTAMCTAPGLACTSLPMNGLELHYRCINTCICIFGIFLHSTIRYQATATNCHQICSKGQPNVPTTAAGNKAALKQGDCLRAKGSLAMVATVATVVTVMAWQDDNHRVNRKNVELHLCNFCRVPLQWTPERGNGVEG